MRIRNFQSLKKNIRNIGISICLPVYNGENYIEKSVKSVMKQNHKKYELLIMINKSSDQTLKICKNLKKKSKKIRLFKQEKLVSAHQNSLDVIKKAKNKYIIFIHHDDIWKNKNYLQTLISKIEKKKVPMGIVNMINKNGNVSKHLSNNSKFSFENNLSIMRRIKFAIYPNIYGKGNFLFGIFEKSIILRIFKSFNNKKILDVNWFYFESFLLFELLKEYKFIRSNDVTLLKRFDYKSFKKKNKLFGNKDNKIKIILENLRYFYTFAKLGKWYESILLIILIPLGVFLGRIASYKNIKLLKK